MLQPSCWHLHLWLPMKINVHFLRSGTDRWDWNYINFTMCKPKSILECLRILVVASETRTVVIGIPFLLPGFVANINYRACYPMRRRCGLLCSQVYPSHYNDVTMSVMASQIISLTIVYLTVYSVADQMKHQSPASLALGAGNSPVTGEFPSQSATNAENVSILWRHQDF